MSPVPKTVKKGLPRSWKRESPNLTNSRDIVGNAGSWGSILRNPRKLQQVPVGMGLVFELDRMSEAMAMPDTVGHLFVESTQEVEPQ